MPSNTAEHRHLRSGSLNIPAQNGHGHGHAKGPANQMAAQRGFDSRSPPNTSHVPCKFFRQGTCQAGSACPFSHDLGAASDTVCKYFSKGNCKFGPKCANIHMLPDGRRINYNKNGFTFSQASVPLGGRVNPNTYHQASNSALTNSFLRAGDAPPYSGTGPYPGAGDGYPHQLSHQPSLENGIPTIDTTYSSNPASVYGSPRDDDAGRFGMGLSPPMNNHVLSVLDAPLPASFDPNGISLAARYGPWPSSVPTKFGLDSPSSSLHSAKAERTSETLKLLHTSAFGSNDHLSPSGLPAPDMGSSPPAPHISDEYFGKRTLHSSSMRYAKPRLMSSSAPKVDRDWENEFSFEEDYVPGELVSDLLTPQEKARRGSMRDGEFGDSTPNSMPKFGSPSRWGPSIPRQRDEDDLGSLGRSMRKVSAFGHVGSPLRNSSLAINMESDGSFGRSAPQGGGEPMSALTQQLQRSRLSDDITGSPSSHLHPNAARGTQGPGVGIIGKEREREKGLERHVSSGSVGSSAAGRYPTPIDEEESPFVFDLEPHMDEQSRNRKRLSGGMSPGAPSMGGWTYASIAGGKNGKSSGRVPSATDRVADR